MIFKEEKMTKFIKLLAVVLLLAGCPEKEGEKAKAVEKNAALGYNMVIVTSNGPVKYNVENAVTKQELTQGLMHREKLAANSGMFFNSSPFIPDGKISLWMENTKIPLDMLFLNKAGEIVYIHENAVPMSRTLITSPVPAFYVIEVNGGDVQKNGISVGDKVLHKFLNNFVPVEDIPVNFEPAPGSDEEDDVVIEYIDETIVDDGQDEETVVAE